MGLQPQGQPTKKDRISKTAPGIQPVLKISLASVFHDRDYIFPPVSDLSLKLSKSGTDKSQEICLLYPNRKPANLYKHQAHFFCELSAFLQLWHIAVLAPRERDPGGNLSTNPFICMTMTTITKFSKVRSVTQNKKMMLKGESSLFEKRNSSPVQIKNRPDDLRGRARDRCNTLKLHISDLIPCGKLNGLKLMFQGQHNDSLSFSDVSVRQYPSIFNTVHSPRDMW